MRASGRTALLPKPNWHRTGPGGRKKHIKRRAKALFFPSLLHGGALFSLRPWIDVPSRFEDGFSCYLLNKDTDLFKSYNMVYPSPESCDPPRGLQCLSLQIFVVTRQPRSIHSPAIDGAVTRIRTEVAAATTQSTNRYTITAPWRQYRCQASACSTVLCLVTTKLWSDGH